MFWPASQKRKVRITQQHQKRRRKCWSYHESSGVPPKTTLHTKLSTKSRHTIFFDNHSHFKSKHFLSYLQTTCKEATGARNLRILCTRAIVEGYIPLSNKGSLICCPPHGGVICFSHSLLRKKDFEFLFHCDDRTRAQSSAALLSFSNAIVFCVSICVSMVAATPLHCVRQSWLMKTRLRARDLSNGNNV